MLMSSLAPQVSPVAAICTGTPLLCCAEREVEDQPRGRSGSVRRDRLQALAQSDPAVVRRPKKTKRTKLERQSTLIRTEVESLPTFWPLFIVFISVAQVSPSS